jgi:hypothetical protein
MSLLPESHQSPELLESIKRNFRMRREKKKTALTQTTLQLRAKEYAAFSVAELTVAFDEGTSQGWDGVFPKSAGRRSNGKPERIMTAAELARAAE